MSASLLDWLSQVFVVTLLNLRTIRQRLASSLVAVVGIAGVVAVFVAVLSMAEGFRKTMADDRLAGHGHRHARRAPTAR